MLKTGGFFYKCNSISLADIFMFPGSDMCEVECSHLQTYCRSPECAGLVTCPHKRTIRRANLKAIAHSIKFFKPDGTLFKEFSNTGYDTSEQYISCLLDLEKELTDFIFTNIPIKPLTRGQALASKRAKFCGEGSCRKRFDRSANPNKNHEAVHDHDHLSGDYRATICGQCNRDRRR